MTFSNSNLTLHEALNALLADSFALYLKTKNFHWHVSGAHFREYHLMFDAQAAQILSITDAIAERIRKTGGSTIRSIGHVGRLQRITDNDEEQSDANSMLVALLDDNRSLAEAVRNVKRLADETNDNATSGMADEWTNGFEERAWFLDRTRSG